MAPTQGFHNFEKQKRKRIAELGIIIIKVVTQDRREKTRSVVGLGMNKSRVNGFGEKDKNSGGKKIRIQASYPDESLTTSCIAHKEFKKNTIRVSKIVHSLISK